MKNIFIIALLALGLSACEDTSTTTETTEEETGTQFTGTSDNTGVTGTTTVIPEGTEATPTETETEVEENNETNTTPTDPVETDPVETNPEETVDPEETTNLDDEVSLEDLTVDQLADIEILRDNIFEGLEIGKELYIQQVNLALEDLGLLDGYTFSEEGDILPEVSSCPFVEFYSNTKPISEASCEYLVDQARSEAYSKLAYALQTNRQGFDSELSELDFWYEQGAVSGLEESRVRLRIDMKAKQVCNQTPTAVESSMEKGFIVGRQHFTSTMNNWLTTNGHKADYPVMSEPIEVCSADESLLNPVYDEAINSITQAVEQYPLCQDYTPVDSDDELMYAQAQTDFLASLEKGIADEFALAAVKIFKTVPCNVSDPLVVDANGNGKLDITELQKGVNFSFTGTRSQATSWVTGGDGFLFVDTNSNGIVDNGSELFGTDTQYGGGFAHLASFDTDKSGFIDHKDEVFKALGVWIDTNQDGVSTKEEIKSLVDIGMMRIDTRAQEYEKSVNGSLIKKVSYVTLSEANKVLVGDVNLRTGVWDKLDSNTTTPDTIRN
mgnify:FL=1|tara:strand:+ start:26 stop:1687 length:1662 start_codon:yes stop_codon:yes gene_type:complete